MNLLKMGCCHTFNWIVYSIILLFISSVSINAQFDLKEKIKNKALEKKEKKERSAEEKIDSTLDAGLDAVEEGIGSLFKKKEPSQKKSVQQQEASEQTEQDTTANKSLGQSAQSLQSYSKFDFVPGETVIFYDDFSQDNVGDFPLLWNTSSKGEVITLNSYPGKWFKLGMGGVFAPEFKGKLPENFTLEYDLIFDVLDWSWAGSVNMDFFRNANSPVESSESVGDYGFKLTCGTSEINYNSWGEISTDGKIANTFFEKNDGKKVRVSIWIQKTRVRLYLNELKVLDLPKIIPANTALQGMRFNELGGIDDASNAVYVTNFRIAVGAPDMRSKLITEGKLVTRGITFDSGSDKIKPESFGVLKEIATVLKDNPTVKVKIIGHTDSDGDDKMNLDLSKRRAAAVKTSLSKDFSIDASRMETDGKGESEPAGPNTTAEGKANNRRVEFIKL